MPSKQQEPLPPIVITKSASSLTVQEDDTVEFTIVVQHTGAATEPAQSVRVEDVIPGEDLAYVADSLKYGETEDYRAFFEPPSGPHLELVKQADVAQINPGGIIEWSLTIFDSGNAPANGVLLYDPIPAGTTYMPSSASAPQGAGAVSQAAAATVEVICPDKPLLTIAKQANVAAVRAWRLHPVHHRRVQRRQGGRDRRYRARPDPHGHELCRWHAQRQRTHHRRQQPRSDEVDRQHSGWQQRHNHLPVAGLAADVHAGALIHNRAGIVPQNPTTPPLIATAQVAGQLWRAKAGDRQEHQGDADGLWR